VEQREHSIVVDDGRTLHFRESGDVDGPLVFAHHGSPGAGLAEPKVVSDAAERGLRMVTHDRPGYGDSTRLPGRRVDHVAADVAAIADHLGVQRFAVWGASGGGPHALACAAQLPDRVVACAAIASPAPYDAEGLDWTAGMGELNVSEIAILAEGPEAHMAFLRREADGMLSAGPAEMRAALSTVLSEIDREALTDELAVHLAENLRLGLKQGVEGWHDESVATYQPWGFDPAAIEVPTQVWHGEQDRFVPAAHGCWLAERIPGVGAHIRAEHGHVSLIPVAVPCVHAWMVELLD
jgi:pimeloyl-ACP methyl ester carboxylesterase